MQQHDGPWREVEGFEPAAPAERILQAHSHSCPNPLRLRVPHVPTFHQRNNTPARAFAGLAGLSMKRHLQPPSSAEWVQSPLSAESTSEQRTCRDLRCGRAEPLYRGRGTQTVLYSEVPAPGTSLQHHSIQSTSAMPWKANNCHQDLIQISVRIARSVAQPSAELDRPIRTESDVIPAYRTISRNDRM